MNSRANPSDYFEDEEDWYPRKYPNDLANKTQAEDGKKKNGNSKNKDKNSKKSQNLAYKYSKKGKRTLCETWFQPADDTNIENIKIVPFIEKATRIIKAPNAQKYPYTAYEFANEEDLTQYFCRANTISSQDELYKLVKGFYQKYVDQDNNIIIILMADSTFILFQNLFPITHIVNVSVAMTVR